jgi:hypothetical protein
MRYHLGNFLFPTFSQKNLVLIPPPRPTISTSKMRRIGVQPCKTTQTGHHCQAKTDACPSARSPCDIQGHFDIHFYVEPVNYPFFIYHHHTALHRSICGARHRYTIQCGHANIYLDSFRAELRRDVDLTRLKAGTGCRSQIPSRRNSKLWVLWRQEASITVN